MCSSDIGFGVLGGRVGMGVATMFACRTLEIEFSPSVRHCFIDIDHKVPI